MIIVEHRINTIEQLLNIDPLHGAEIDLRSDPNSGRIYLHHDPFSPGESLEDWLNVFAERKVAGPLILNTKEDGLEERVLFALHQREIENFFFLDTCLPTLVKWTARESRFACRLSAYEPVESALPFIGKADWLWVDCFAGCPLPFETLNKICSYFKVCLVSPELHGILQMAPEFLRLRNLADAVCTKSPSQWEAASEEYVVEQVN
ncbi:MAG: hypothetical protein NTX25_23405 [Proteobacteria bacterium]|nr:hypothetical protein [Pseudomonadota bacterium]